MGLYQRPDSDVYWISYNASDGRRVRESTRTNDKEAAKRLLKDREGRAARGEVMLPRVDRITYDEARADLVAYYKTSGDRDLSEAEARLRHLDEFFSKRRLVTITPDVVTAYAAERQANRKDENENVIPGAANGTINRELATLSKMLRLAFEHGKLQRPAIVKKLREADPRAGFVTREQFASVRKHLPEELRVAATVAYTFGWRKREVLDLQKGQYSTQEGTLRLDPGKTKNREGRVVRLTPELRAMLDAQVARVRELERKVERVIPWLFPHLDEDDPRARSRTDRVGQRIRDPRKAWESACKAAGLPGLLIHDLRRSAVRNMEQAGVPRSVAMKLTGHKTENVYRRYAIVSEADLDSAAVRLAEAASRSVSRSTASA
jgi:integrase